MKLAQRNWQSTVNILNRQSSELWITRFYSLWKTARQLIALPCLTFFTIGPFWAVNGKGRSIIARKFQPFRTKISWYISQNNKTWHSYSAKEDPKNKWITSEAPYVLLKPLLVTRNWQLFSFCEIRKTNTPKSTMEDWLFWALAIEIFHSVNELNPVYIQSLYEQNINSNRHKNDLKVSTENFVVFGGKSAKVLEPSIWNIFRQS